MRIAILILTIIAIGTFLTTTLPAQEITHTEKKQACSIDFNMTYTEAQEFVAIVQFELDNHRVNAMKGLVNKTLIDTCEAKKQAWRTVAKNIKKRSMKTSDTRTRVKEYTLDSYDTRKVELVNQFLQ